MMKKGLFAVLALLIVFAMISCDDGSGSGSNDITIKFDLDGGPGEKPNDVTLTKGGSLGDKYPNMEGNATHEFLGWYNGNTEITRDTKLNASVTLIAKWDVLPEVQEGYMRITFNLNGAPGTPPQYIDLEKGTAIAEEQIPEDPVWPGYVFEGWYNEDTKLVAGLSWQDSIVFIARWIESSGGLSLTPWKPDTNPTEPTTGYKDYYDGIDFEDWSYTSYAGVGDVASIEDNGDGTYNVIIKTKPGGVSILAFTSDTYTFKNGYYLLLDFPTNTEAKPIMALTGAATGSRNDDGQDWLAIYNVNREDAQGYVPINDDVYLAGEIAFARDDLDTLYKSIVLTLVWHEDEEAEYYEFTLKKILITTGEDLTPPDISTMTPWSHEVEEPENWIKFPLNDEPLAATFYPWNESNAISGNTVTVISVAGNRSLVRLYNEESEYQKGFYVSVNLPEDSVKPEKIYALAITSPTDDGDWTASTLVQPPDITNYVAGRVDFTWASDASTKAYTGVLLDIYWYGEQTDALYTFTVNKILVAEEAGEAIPPSDLVEWTPEELTEPTDWVDFPGTDTLTATYYPWSANTTGTTITAAKEATGRTLIRLSGDTFTYQKGIYVSVTLPNDSFKPEKIYLYGSTTKLEGGIVWGTETDIIAPTGKFIAGKADFYWDGSASTDVLQGIILDIYWYPDQEAGSYSFTINSIKVAEEATGGPPAETPGIHDSSELEDATYTVGDEAAQLKVVPSYTDNSGTYDYNWYFIKDPATEPPDPATFSYYKWNGDGTNGDAQGVYIVPPTDEAGTFYYYVTITFGSEITRSPLVKIVVAPEE